MVRIRGVQLSVILGMWILNYLSKDMLRKETLTLTLTLNPNPNPNPNPNVVILECSK